MLFLNKPYAEFRAMSANRASLTALLNQSPNHSSEMGRLAEELKRLTEKLSGELRLPASDDKMAASLMEALDRSAALHGVTLSSVKPGVRKQISVFEEVSFEISAKGAYLKLCGWMLDFENTLGNNATITEFDMKSSDDGKKVALSLNVALYRPIKLNEASQ